MAGRLKHNPIAQLTTSAPNVTRSEEAFISSRRSLFFWLANPVPCGAFRPVSSGRLPTAFVENKQENGEAPFF
jgi:hypothetical protein